LLDSQDFDSYYNSVIQSTTPATEVDEKILGNFMRRRLIYGDIVQSFGEEELRKILLQSGNKAPIALLIMRQMIRTGQHINVFQPPGYFKFDGIHDTKDFFLPHEQAH
jgi:hypothetical protein